MFEIEKDIELTPVERGLVAVVFMACIAIFFVISVASWEWLLRDMIL